MSSSTHILQLMYEVLQQPLFSVDAILGLLVDCMEIKSQYQYKNDYILALKTKKNCAFMNTGAQARRERGQGGGRLPQGHVL